MKPLIDILHILLCNKRHEYNMVKVVDRNPQVCYYYLESDIAECDTLPDHKEWQGMADNFKVAMDCETEEEALEFVKDVMKLSQEFNRMAGGHRLRKEFIQSLLK